MTKRAVTIGLMLAAFIAGVNYFNYAVMKQTSLIGHYMPPVVFGFLLLSVLLVNPLAAKFYRAASLRGGELAVITVLGLAACCVPGEGLLKYLTNNLMLPHQQVKTRVDWQPNAAIEMLPGHMLAGTPPTFLPDDLLDPAAIRTELTAASRRRSVERVWQLLEPADQQRLQAATSPEAERAAIVQAFNTLLRQPGLYDPALFGETGDGIHLSLPPEAGRILRRYSQESASDLLAATDDRVARLLSEPRVSTEHIQRFNRHIIDAIWGQQIRSYISRHESEVMAFYTGANSNGMPVGLSEIPWQVWQRPLSFWLPLFLLMSFTVIGLSLVVHRQWSKNELLVYPIARFANSLMPGEEGGETSVLRRPLFLVPLGIIFAIGFMNYLNNLWPEYTIHFPTTYDFTALSHTTPSLDNGYARWALFLVRISPLAVGIAYLLRTDVSLSVGLSVPTRMLITGVLASVGISLAGRGGGGLYSGSGMQLFSMGAYLAFVVQMAYTGRRYYLAVLKSALGRESTEDVTVEAIWGARVFLVGALAFTVYLTVAGVDWQIALLYTGLAIGLFLVMSRVLAETGIFYFMAGWYPGAALVGLLGAEFVGPSTGLILFMVSSLILVRPQEALMPFLVTGLKILEKRDVQPAKVAPWLGATVILAMVIAVPVTLMCQYGGGANQVDGARVFASYPFRKAVQMREEISAKGRWEQVEATEGFERFSWINLDPTNTTMFLVGFLGVILLAFARQRLSWWPLHPVFVLMMTAGTAVLLWHSFMLGWLIKKLVMRYGGHSANGTVTTMFMGVIAGDILGQLIPLIINALYFLYSGEKLPAPPSILGG